MKPWHFWSALGLCLLPLSGLGTTFAPTGDPVPPVWLTESESAQVVARETGKPLFVLFR